MGYISQVREDAAFFATLDSIGSPIFVVDRQEDGDFRIVHLNRYFKQRQNLPVEAMMAGPVTAVFPPRTAAALVRNYVRALCYPDPYCFDETHVFDGVSHTWRTTLSRVEAEDGRYRRIVGVAVPVTDLSRTGEKLAAEIADLRRDEAALRALAGLTAHDMRAPLSNIVSLLEIVLDGFRDLGDGKAELLRTCIGTAETSLSGIAEMVERFRRKTVANEGHREPVDLAHLCRDIVALADPSERLDIRYPKATVTVDRIVLTVALRNVLDNAVRYATGQVRVTLERDHGKGTVTLDVSDDGPGFAPGTDPLAEAVQKDDRTDGRGFGLRAVISLLASRGGSLDYAPSCFGQGAALRIRLPAT